MAYYHLPRDTAPFVAGTDDDVFYAVYLYYPGSVGWNGNVNTATDFSIATVDDNVCYATASDATEQQKFDCGQVRIVFTSGPYSISRYCRRLVDPRLDRHVSTASGRGLYGWLYSRHHVQGGAHVSTVLDCVPAICQYRWCGAVTKPRPVL